MIYCTNGTNGCECIDFSVTDDSKSCDICGRAAYLIKNLVKLKKKQKKNSGVNEVSVAPEPNRSFLHFTSGETGRCQYGFIIPHVYELIALHVAI